MSRLFISYTRLESWLEENTASLEAHQLTLADGRALLMEPAVAFRSVLGDEADPHQLLGKAKSESQLKEMGAEHVQDSVILGDVGYQVLDGLMGQSR